MTSNSSRLVSLMRIKRRQPVPKALRDITFTARQGEITALVGPSGSGKSTVANLIPRFWDVAEGEIRIGGVNIKKYSHRKVDGHCFLCFPG